MAVSRKAMTEGISTIIFQTIPQSKIKDFCQLPLHKALARQPRISKNLENIMKHFHLLPWVIVALLILAAFILRFVLWGYSFSALVCCCLAGIIAFYEITGMLLPAYPAVVPILRRIFTGCLAVGIAVVTVTEGIIINAT